MPNGRGSSQVRRVLRPGRAPARSCGVPLALALATLTLLCSPPADAEPLMVNVQRFQPSPHAGDLLTLRHAGLRPDQASTAGLFFSYGRNPLVLIDKSGASETAYRVVSDQTLLEVFGSVMLFERLSLGLNVPMVPYGAGSDALLNMEPPSGFDAADMRLSARWAFLPRDVHGLGLAVEPEVTLPLATAYSYAGDSGVTLTPRVVVDYGIGETVFAFNAGVKLRRSQNLIYTRTSSELQAGVGASHSLVRGRYMLLGELDFATQTHDLLDGNGTALEGQIGGAICLAKQFQVFVAGGGGLLRGVGSTSLRLTTGLRHGRCEREPVILDRDRDGIPDARDACPDKPGAAHQDPARHGCPPPDRDKDGVPDEVDACPDKPGVPDPDPAKNGCAPDRDGDGIADAIDACPDLPGVADDDPKRHGCPRDSDGDGIPDLHDACPKVPGVKNPDPAKNGCPPDRDGDGIPDPLDACPDTPGLPSPDRVKNGCPKPRVTATEIVIVQRVQFDVDSVVIQPRFHSVLNDVAALINAHPELLKIEIGGHTDSTHTPQHNMRLSWGRSRSVKHYLVERGVAPHRLEERGFGMTQPVDTNATADGRLRNRRVVFKILKRSEP